MDHSAICLPACWLVARHEKGYIDQMVADHFPHDAAYKTFFSNPEMVKSLLQDFVPEAFVRDFDFASLEQCQGSYTSVDLQERHDDIVWRLRWKDHWCYIYILLEFQSTQDQWMALRILAYTALLWQDLIKKGHIKAGDKLPPIFPIVVYNGLAKWQAAQDVHDLVAQLPAGLAVYQPRQKYFLLDENQIAENILDEAAGASAWLFRLERASTPDKFREILRELSQVFSDDFSKRAMTKWAAALLKRKAPAETWNDLPTEDIPMLEERIEQWHNEILQKGILLGKEEGWLLGKEEGITNQKQTLLDMLTDRFGEIPPGWRTAINRLADPALISQLTRAVLKVKSSHEYSSLLAVRDKGRKPGD